MVDESTTPPKCSQTHTLIEARGGIKQTLWKELMLIAAAVRIFIRIKSVIASVVCVEKDVRVLIR